MNEEYIDNVKHLIEQKDADQVKELLADLHPADIAELCNDLNPEEAKFVYRLLNNETAADVLVEMDEDVRKEFLEMIPSETIAKRFVDYMDTDDAVDLMRDLDEDMFLHKKMIEFIPAQFRSDSHIKSKPHRECISTRTMYKKSRSIIVIPCIS